MIKLPTEKVLASSKSPKRLILFSNPKVGKSTALSLLPDSLLIDFENGTDYLDAVKVKINTASELKELIQTLKEANTKKGGFVYRYGIIDTVTALEDLIMPVALAMYKATPIGKSFTGDNILTLPQGAGYYWQRLAFATVVNDLADCFERLILSGHLKEKFITKDDKELEVRGLDLTGKLASITAGASDAIGYVYRKGNQVRINFKNTEGVIAGSRPEHLSNQDIVLTESDPVTGKITAYWDRIFVD
jgi:uncharacterized protein (DUF302 family)